MNRMNLSTSAMTTPPAPPRRKRALSGTKRMRASLRSHILLLKRAPAGGADGILAFLEGGEIAFDAACITVFLKHGKHLLSGADRGAVGLRWINAETETHRFQLARRHHRRFAAFEHIYQGRPFYLARDDLQLLDILWR